MKNCLALFFFALLWAACSNPNAVKTHVVESNGAAIEIPESLKPTEQDNDVRALLDYENLEEGVFCLVYRDEKSALEAAGTPYDLAGYFAFVAGNYQNGLNGSTLANATNETINGLSARQGTVEGNVEGGTVFMQLAAYESPEAFYQVAIWCEGKDKARMAEVFGKAVRSFKGK